MTSAESHLFSGCECDPCISSLFPSVCLPEYLNVLWMDVHGNLISCAIKLLLVMLMLISCIMFLCELVHFRTSFTFCYMYVSKFHVPVCVAKVCSAFLLAA